MPKAVNSCHIMTRAPLTDAVEHSAAYTGIVALFGPMPNPRKRRKTNIVCQSFANACPRAKATEHKAARKIVPLRPSQWLRGQLSLQQVVSRILAAKLGHGI